MLLVVFQLDRDNTIPVTVEHIPDEQYTVAYFDWRLAQPKDTYTIDIYGHVQIELDSHFPVRPASIAVDNQGHEESLTTLEHLVGATLVSAIQSAPQIGFCAIELVFSKGHRLAIAELQTKSLTTPDILKRACQAML